MNKTIVGVSSQMIAKVERSRDLPTLLETPGNFVLEHWRSGKLIATIPFPNGATNVGKQYMLGAAFAGTTPITTWYLGLIDGTGGTPVLDPADIMSSHAGWTEFGYYNEAVRQTWSKTINTLNNTMGSVAAAQFTISSGVPASAFVAGGFLNSVSTKAGTTGTLWAHGLFASPVPVQSTDIFKLNYTTGLT